MLSHDKYPISTYIDMYVALPTYTVASYKYPYVTHVKTGLHEPEGSFLKGD
jgi:hypothetical protein